MNANELADIADGLSIEIPIREWIDNEPKNIMNDIATMLRQQQAEIEVLKKFIAEGNALDKKLNKSIQKANEIWNRATNSILRKAQE